MEIVEVKIADFGLSDIVQNREDQHEFTQKCGTPGFMAPEIFHGLGYSQKCDVFSLGAVFYYILTQ